MPPWKIENEKARQAPGFSGSAALNLGMTFASCRHHLVSRVDVGRLQTLGAGGNVEADALAFLQGLETLALNCGEVREQIVATAFRGDETKTF
jgi:hypothetical protein